MLVFLLEYELVQPLRNKLSSHYPVEWWEEKESERRTVRRWARRMDRRTVRRTERRMVRRTQKSSRVSVSPYRVVSVSVLQFGPNLSTPYPL